MSSRVCGTCGNSVLENESAREFDGKWYHNTACIKTAIDAVGDELFERGLKAGDLVYVMARGWESGRVALEPAVLVNFVASNSGWTAKWKVHYLQDQSDETYVRDVSPAYLIRRVTETLTIPINSEGLY